MTDGRQLAGEEVVFCTGDPQWYDKITPSVARPEPVAPCALEQQVRLAPMTSDSRLEVTSPSQLEGGARVRVARILDLASSVATTRGTLIHALFEQVHWLDDGLPDPSQSRRVAQSLSGEGLDVGQQLAAFQGMLEAPDVAAVLRRAFYESPRDESLQQALAGTGTQGKLQAIVHNERRFAVHDQGRLLSGIMDRIVLLYDGERLAAADIIDYKTDTAQPDDAAGLGELVEFYRPQIEAYRRAAATMFHLSPRQISARLLFVSPGAMRSL